MAQSNQQPHVDSFKLSAAASASGERETDVDDSICDILHRSTGPVKLAIWLVLAETNSHVATVRLVSLPSNVGAWLHRLMVIAAHLPATICPPPHVRIDSDLMALFCLGVSSAFLFPPLASLGYSRTVSHNKSWNILIRMTVHKNDKIISYLSISWLTLFDPFRVSLLWFGSELPCHVLLHVTILSVQLNNQPSISYSIIIFLEMRQLDSFISRTSSQSDVLEALLCCPIFRQSVGSFAWRLSRKNLGDDP